MALSFLGVLGDFFSAAWAAWGDEVETIVAAANVAEAAWRN